MLLIVWVKYLNILDYKSMYYDLKNLNKDLENIITHDKEGIRKERSIIIKDLESFVDKLKSISKLN